MLSRVLEPEVMDSLAEAIEYDSMDHAEVNRRFATDLLATNADLSDVLDVGVGTAQIPIEICRISNKATIVGVDAAPHMLAIGQKNIAAAELSGRVTLHMVDAKQLPYPDERFSSVISNSIVHHIPEPRSMLVEAIRVCVSKGTLFIRDLLRPADMHELNRLVELYAGGATKHQRQLFAESLHAALTLREIQDLVAEFGFEPHSVAATSDRHWTWAARKP
jgi:ubiquinone/menaquinone biosynthesis C-methylase UbiE